MEDPSTLPPVVQPQTKPGLLSKVRALDGDLKAIFSIGGVVVLVFVAGRGCDIVSAEDLAKHSVEQGAVDAKQDATLEKFDTEREQQFILNAVLEQKISTVEKQQTWTNEALWRMARDLGLNEGHNGLKPPPTPTPKATP